MNLTKLNNRIIFKSHQKLSSTVCLFISSWLRWKTKPLSFTRVKKRITKTLLNSTYLPSIPVAAYWGQFPWMHSHSSIEHSLPLYFLSATVCVSMFQLCLWTIYILIMLFCLIMLWQFIWQFYSLRAQMADCFDTFCGCAQKVQNKGWRSTA